LQFSLPTEIDLIDDSDDGKYAMKMKTAISVETTHSVCTKSNKGCFKSSPNSYGRVFSNGQFGYICLVMAETG